MKRMHARNILAGFGLEPRRPALKKTATALGLLGLGGLLGAGLALATRSEKVRRLWAKARKHELPTAKNGRATPARPSDSKVASDVPLTA